MGYFDYVLRSILYQTSIQNTQDVVLPLIRQIDGYSMMFMFPTDERIPIMTLVIN